MPRTEAAAGPDLIAALFAPRAVALIGASDDAAKTAARPLRFLRRHGYEGTVYPVNPRRDRVLGETAYPDIGVLPGPVDHAYVLTPTEGVNDAVAACAAHGVPVVTILADGFGGDGEGAARRARLVAAARDGGVRLLGPNSIGVVNCWTGLALTANAAFAAERLIRGRVALLSQSGNVLGTLLTRGQARGLGYSKMVSVGIEADLGIGEIGAGLVDDPETDAFVLFLESLRGADELAGFAARTAAAGKPIIAYKLGRSEAGRDAATSHSGAMVGADEAADAFLRAHGILRVDQLESMVEAPPLVAGQPPPDLAADDHRRAVAVVATTGGGATMVVDRLGLAGVPVRAPDAGVIARLAGKGIAVSPGRVVDLTLAGTRYEAVFEALSALIEAPDNGGVVAVVGSSAEFQPELAVRPVIDAAARARAAGKPLAALVLPHGTESLHRLAEAGVAAFRTPESCADALAAYFAWQRPRATASPAGPDLAAAQALLQGAPGPVLDPAQSLALFEALGIAAAPFALSPPGETPTEPPFGFPVAAKLAAPGLAHKTEAGGVILDLADAEALAAAAERLTAAAARQPGTAGAAIMVQRMERGLAEVLVGYRVDPDVGPLAVIGAGGVLTELYRDIAVRPAPMDAGMAREMIEEVTGLAVLRGYRGLPEGDIGALADAAAALSRLALIDVPALLEAEINPLIVRAAGQGAVAVDGLVRLAG